jgi:hypothetical protein
MSCCGKFETTFKQDVIPCTHLGTKLITVTDLLFVDLLEQRDNLQRDYTRLDQIRFLRQHMPFRRTDVCPQIFALQQFWFYFELSVAILSVKIFPKPLNSMS